jgi:hypothetical protein
VPFYDANASFMALLVGQRSIASPPNALSPTALLECIAQPVPHRSTDINVAAIVDIIIIITTAALPRQPLASFSMLPAARG